MRGKAVLARMILLVLLAQLAALPALGVFPDRRKDQFPTEFAYLIIPAPYSLPGIGEGIAAFSLLANVFESTADLYLYKIMGDVTGTGFGVQELPLFTNHLFFQMGGENISNAQVFNYYSRGMESHQNEYKILDLSNLKSRYGYLALNMFERRVEFSYNFFNQEMNITGIRDYKGEMEDPDFSEHSKYKGKYVSMLVDATDDYYDPLSGVRLMATRNLPEPPETTAEPDYYNLEYMLNVYFPVGEVSTLAVDYFRSMAIVNHPGANLDADVDFLCNPVPPDPACPYVKSKRDHNKHGSAASLGGRDRLRAYPDGRFQGAQAEYYGVELRWNFSQEVAPFNWWIWKDIRTGLQVALIGEWGSVAETAGDLWKNSRKDFGIGFRMITASGGVYRFDFASGDEGAANTIIVMYPW
ncbi:MAG: hypothetical protein OEZ59_05680 [Deltaproteobacteria bacterium]|nr:hypothetical protein [Deltaproteobacteria bacterium]